MGPDERFERVKAVVMKYCNPKKEFDHIAPSEVIQKILDAADNKGATE